MVPAVPFQSHARGSRRAPNYPELGYLRVKPPRPAAKPVARQPQFWSAYHRKPKKLRITRTMTTTPTNQIMLFI